ncbi:MAG: PAS domain-containing protein [Halorhodospira sp.]
MRSSGEWEVDSDTVHWDDACWRMLGYDPAEQGLLSFADWRAQLHPDDRVQVESVVLDQIQCGEPFTIEFRYRCADGDWLWVLARGQVMERAPDGSPQRVLGTHVEIEQLKRTELALRRREQELAEAKRIGQLGHWHYDVQTGALEWSEEIYAFFGVDPAEGPLSFERFLEMVSPEDRATILACREQLLQRGGFHEFEHRIQRPDGRERTLHERGYAVFDDAGRPLCIRGTTQDVTEQRAIERELRERQDWLDREQEIAERIIARAMRSDDLEAPGLRYAYQPAAILSGDILLAERRPNGNLLILIGDFTGHGIGAAVGVPGLAMAFYEQVSRGVHPALLLEDINDRLYQSLPTDMFLAAALIEVDAWQARVGVWNAGMPPLWLLRGHEVVARFDASALPLGVMPGSAQGQKGLAYVPVPEGCYLYACSDGIVEAVDDTGAQYGVEGVERILVDVGPEKGLDHFLERVRALRSDKEQRDDMTLVALELDRLLAEHQRADCDIAGSVDCHIELVLDELMIARTNPVPAVMELLDDLLTLGSDRQNLYVVVAELYNNALEHGVLGLDSSLKDSADGFEAYYQQRREALERLTSGEIIFRLACDPDSADGQGVIIEIEDSGPGFNYEQVLTDQDAGHLADVAGGALAAGHGILLVRSLCQEVTYFSPGNRVRARYSLQ